MSSRHQLGDATLELVANDCMLTVLNMLSRGEVRAGDIESDAAGISRRTALRRLQSLAADGFAETSHEHVTDRSGDSDLGPARAPYVLTKLGREWLLKIPAAAADCEQKWCSPPSKHFGGPGLWTLRLVSDPHTRGLARALADAPLRQSELLARLPHLGRSTLLERLKTLSEDGLLVREEHSGGVRYGLADSVRHLVIIEVRAAQCEWQRATPKDRTLTRDLPGLLHVLAPLGRIARETSGTCRWHLNLVEADIHLAARSGKLAALSTAPITAHGANGHANPHAWCEALLEGDPSRIATTGDKALFNAIFTGLSTALLA